MKPKQLQYPFSWDERHVLLKDRVLYVPDYYDRYQEFTFPGWESTELFAKPQPVAVEYCSGNGAWIIEKAKAHPDINWVAVEKRFDRVRKIYSKRHNEGLENLLIVSGEALTTTRHFFPASSVSNVYINFPDPWPKDRHAKHRLVTPPFVEQVGRILTNQGRLLLVTDHELYAEESIASIRQNPNFQSCCGERGFTKDRQNYGPSFFDSLWRSLGREILFVEFEKQAVSNDRV